ncbi:uncharacterized protein [Euwallacea fornicatus]|uniref:uncharacterized protein isoform X2 n=1 Tax=Euwallacea fornicatus TaxID=995702 RepID=UPI00338DCB2A
MSINRKIFALVVLLACSFQHAESACERSAILLGAEDVCWGSTVKVVDRIQYTTKSVLNFAKEKLGLDKDEPFNPQQCDYYQCIFKQMKLLNENGYPNYEKMVDWVDKNVIYNHAKTQYDLLKQCNRDLTDSIESDTYFSGSSSSKSVEGLKLQNKCEVSQEFMKCIANNTQCTIFMYP